MKKLLSLVLAAMMVMSLAACGGDKPASTPAGTEGTKETLKIGGIGPLTGDYANYGISVKQGVEQAVKEINAAGGIAGQQLELSFQDSQGDPESARERGERLRETA